jgi:chemotaxis protein MotB
MRRVSPFAWLFALLGPAMFGCTQNPLFRPLANAERQKLVATQEQHLAQTRELQQKANALDANNSDLHRRLATSQQRVDLLNKEISLLRKQLGDTASQLAQMSQSKQQADQQVQALTASARRGGGATITANNSLSGDLTAIDVPGAEVRQDGDVVRIELPADRLFIRGSATLHQGAPALLGQVSSAVAENYPRQIIGIEAHTDSDPPSTSNWHSNHQLSAAQAIALFGELTQRYRISPQQLFVLGHGSNQPIASNGTLAGKARNRRVELVIYPETLAGR